MTRIGFYSGTFDPVTLGHTDVIGRAAGLVDKLVIGIGVNPFKAPLFTEAERVAMLEDEVRHSTGVLVKKINPQAVSATLAELETPSRTRRLRGIGVATAMGAVPELETAIIALIDDEDHVIRAEAVRALAYCDTSAARAALEAALGDRSIVVQETAAQSLEVLDSVARVGQSGRQGGRS